jgi:EpsI family protein
MAYYGLSKERPVDLLSPLSTFPAAINGWTMRQELPVEKDVLDVLKADATLSRYYSSSGRMVNLFIAFFRSQGTGVSPHSPKNCLPGSGWAVSHSGTLDIAVPGIPEPIRVNQYLVSKGESKSLVLYWYQSHNRVIASEYLAKIYLVIDSLRYRRSDTSIVRVTVPIFENNDDAARKAAIDFVSASFPSVNQMLPQ